MENSTVIRDCRTANSDHYAPSRVRGAERANAYTSFNEWVGTNASMIARPRMSARCARPSKNGGSTTEPVNLTRIAMDSHQQSSRHDPEATGTDFTYEIEAGFELGGSPTCDICIGSRRPWQTYSKILLTIFFYDLKYVFVCFYKDIVSPIRRMECDFSFGSLRLSCSCLRPGMKRTPNGFRSMTRFLRPF
jgi:hypothetical protein